MNTVISFSCLFGLFLVMAQRKRADRPRPALLLLAIGLGLTAIGAAMYSVLHDDDSRFEANIAAATCKVRLERSDFVASAVKGKLPALEKTVLLFNAKESDDIVQVQSRCFLEKSGCPQSFSVERLHPQPAHVPWVEFKSVVVRHPGKVLFVSFCGLPSSNADANAKEFWTESTEARFLVCDALATEIDSAALENNLLLGWCLELFNGGRHFEMVTKDNAEAMQGSNPILFSGALEIPEVGDAGEIIQR